MGICRDKTYFLSIDETLQTECVKEIIKTTVFLHMSTTALYCSQIGHHNNQTILMHYWIAFLWLVPTGYGMLNNARSARVTFVNLVCRSEQFRKLVQSFPGLLIFFYFLGNGNIRQLKGFLEIYHLKTWRPVCYDYRGWSSTQGRVACRQLGYSDYTNSKTTRATTNDFWIEDIKCDGHEKRIVCSQTWLFAVNYCLYFLSVVGRQDCCVHKLWGDESCYASDAFTISCANRMCIYPEL